MKSKPNSIAANPAEDEAVQMILTGMEKSEGRGQKHEDHG
jgi:hypothetical protein